MDRVTFNRLRRQPGYPLFFTTATVTRFADDMFSVGAVLLVLDRTGSAALAGAIVAAVTFPSVVTGPLLGAWLDRTGNRRRLMMLDQVLAASTLVALVLLIGHAPDWVIPIVALGAGITWPLSFGGFTSFIPVLVPEELLPPANALEATSFNLAIITGPALAGTICALAGPAASLLTEAVLTVGMIGFIAKLPALDTTPGRRTGRRLLEIVRSGLRHIVVVPPLRAVTVAGAISLGGLGMLTVAYPFFAVEALGESRSAAGFLWASFAAGSAVSAIALVGTQTRWPSHLLAIAAIGALGATMLLWPLAGSLPVAMALIALSGVVDGPGFAAQFAVRQRWTPRNLHGQVFTTAASMKVGAFALGSAAAGPAVVGLGARGAIVVAAVAQFVAAGAGLLLGGLRETRPPAELSDPESDGSDLEQDDDVDHEREGEPDRPAIQVSLHE